MKTVNSYTEYRLYCTNM